MDTNATTIRLRIRRWLWALMTCACLPLAQADNYYILSQSPELKHHQNVTQWISEAIRRRDADARIFTDAPTDGESAYRFLLGKKACLKHANTTGSICLLSTKEELQSLETHRGSAVWLDFPVDVKIRAVRELFDVKGPIGLTDKSELPKTLYVDLNDKRRIRNNLRSASRDTYVLIVLPESQVFKRDTAKAIILNAYKDKIALVGYSEAMTKAGAALSIHNDLEAMSKEAVDILLSGKSFRGYSQYHETSINKTIIKSLGLNVND